MNLIVTNFSNHTLPRDFSFNNFDELKGFLKGKTIIVDKNLPRCKQILSVLGFAHSPRLVSLTEYCSNLENFEEYMIIIANDTFEIYLADELPSNTKGIYVDDIVEAYFELKEDLIYSIIPYPITIEEARGITLEKLNKLNIFCSEMLDRIESLDLDEEDVEAFIGSHGIDIARDMVDNYEIQLDNLKFIW